MRADLLALNACININAHDKGLAVLHKYVCIDLYGHFGDVEMSQELFDSTTQQNKDVVTVGCMIHVLSHNQQDTQALALCERYHGLHNDILHLQAIKTCIKTNDFAKGKDIHRTLRQTDIEVALIDFCGHFGDIESARQIFDGITTLNVVCKTR